MGGSRRRSLLLVASMVCLICGGTMAARADTSTIGIDVGQLVIADAQTVQLDWQDIFVSPDEVRVSFQFTNVGPEVVKSKAILPLAPLDFAKSLNYSVVSGQRKNIIGLDVTVDGKPVKPDFVARAQLGGKDITELLEGHGVPVVPFAIDFEGGWETYYKELEALPENAREELDAAGALSFEDPTWVVLSAFQWPVTLRPDRPVEISFRYTPVPATDLLTRESLSDQDLKKRYCFDGSFASSVAARLSNADGAGAAVVAHQIGYVWAVADIPRRTIGRLYVTIDHADERTLVSMCARNTANAGPTAFRMERFDFKPEGRFDVLFVRDLSTQ